MNSSGQKCHIFKNRLRIGALAEITGINESLYTIYTRRNVQSTDVGFSDNREGISAPHRFLYDDGFLISSSDVQPFFRFSLLF
jgi:hypothetical protein